MRIKDNKLLSGALILTIGGLITKVLGAVYRIPLTRILGAEGIGLYQMVFPLYTLLLTLSSTGVPNGIAKVISSGKDANTTLKTALITFGVIGFFASLLMFIFAKNIALFQGNVNAKGAYRLIAPSVFLVSIISCFRGYYQGLANMVPTAISQVLEQAVKLCFGLGLCYAFKGDVAVKASLATLSVTISELLALLYLIIISKKNLRSFKVQIRKRDFTRVLKVVFPVALSTLVMPISRTVESFFAINLLGNYLANATAYFGLYSGAVESLVSVPVAVLYGIAVSVIPIISSLKANGNSYNKKIFESLILTFVLSVLAGLLTYFLSNFLVEFLYKTLSPYEKILIVKMLKLASLSVATLPLMQTSASILIATGNVYRPVISSLLGAVVKIILSIFLLKVKTVNIFALIISDIVCYLVACFLNLVYIIRVNGKRKEKVYE